MQSSYFLWWTHFEKFSLKGLFPPIHPFDRSLEHLAMHLADKNNQLITSYGRQADAYQQMSALSDSFPPYITDAFTPICKLEHVAPILPHSSIRHSILKGATLKPWEWSPDLHAWCQREQINLSGAPSPSSVVNLNRKGNLIGELNQRLSESMSIAPIKGVEVRSMEEIKNHLDAQHHPQQSLPMQSIWATQDPHFWRIKPDYGHAGLSQLTFAPSELKDPRLTKKIEQMLQRHDHLWLEPHLSEAISMSILWDVEPRNLTSKQLGTKPSITKPGAVTQTSPSHCSCTPLAITLMDVNRYGRYQGARICRIDGDMYPSSSQVVALAGQLNLDIQVIQSLYAALPHMALHLHALTSSWAATGLALTSPGSNKSRHNPHRLRNHSAHTRHQKRSNLHRIHARAQVRNITPGRAHPLSETELTSLLAENPSPELIATEPSLYQGALGTDLLIYPAQSGSAATLLKGHFSSCPNSHGPQTQSAASRHSPYSFHGHLQDSLHDGLKVYVCDINARMTLGRACMDIMQKSGLVCSTWKILPSSKVKAAIKAECTHQRRRSRHYLTQAHQSALDDVDNQQENTRHNGACNKASAMLPQRLPKLAFEIDAQSLGTCSETSLKNALGTMHRPDDGNKDSSSHLKIELPEIELPYNLYLL